MRSTGERERSRVQRLLLEGMQLVVDDAPASTSEDSEDGDTGLPPEVYGHLAAALRSQLVEATDERLETFTSKHFLKTLTHTFTICARRPPPSACPSASLQGI